MDGDVVSSTSAASARCSSPACGSVISSSHRKESIAYDASARCSIAIDPRSPRRSWPTHDDRAVRAAHQCEATTEGTFHPVFWLASLMTTRPLRRTIATHSPSFSNVATANCCPVRSFGLGVETGGERGIRTLGRVSPTHAFQASAFNHSAISPFKSITYDRDNANCVRPPNVQRSLTDFPV